MQRKHIPDELKQEDFQNFEQLGEELECIYTHELLGALDAYRVLIIMASQW